MTRIIVQSGNGHLYTIHCAHSHVLQKELGKSCVVDDIVAFAVYALDGLHRSELHPLRDAFVFHKIGKPGAVMSAVMQPAEQRAS